MARVQKRVTAKRDLIDHFVFLAENASLDVARRFLRACHDTFQILASRPQIGVRRKFRNSQFASVRMWPIRGFERYPIFYRPNAEGVEVLRVVHGSRDIERLFL